MYELFCVEISEYIKKDCKASLHLYDGLFDNLLFISRCTEKNNTSQGSANNKWHSAIFRVYPNK